MALFLSVLFLLLPSSGNILQDSNTPTHRIALSVTGQEQPLSAQQLELAEEIGIRLFEIRTPSEAQEFQSEDFRFLVDTGPFFTIPGTADIQKNEIAQQVVSGVSNLPERVRERIVAVSILHYPFDGHPEFPETAAALADTLDSLLPETFYFHSAFTEEGSTPAGISFISHRTAPQQPGARLHPVMHFSPSENDYDSYAHLNQLFGNLEPLDESITVIPAGWFYQQLEKDPDLRFLFTDFMNGESVELPLPEPSRSEPVMNWSVILLMLIWGSFALHFRYQPIYSQSVTRYFSNHTFFVNDVRENRLRNIWPGIILLVQHMLLTGLFVFASVEVVVSTVGLDVIRHHFDPIITLNSTLPSLFVAGILVAFLLQAVSVAWIFAANKKLMAFSQILNLYSWPLHLNLIVVTFLVVFNRVGFDEVWILILSFLFILIWFFSFNIAAIDSSKFLDDGRTLFLTGTVGLHVLLVIGILVYVLYTPGVIEPILYAISVP
ncbi:MAG: hypothetical protein R6V27_07375 [Balneolaceae bacterium]